MRRSHTLASYLDASASAPERSPTHAPSFTRFRIRFLTHYSLPTLLLLDPLNGSRYT